MVAGPRVRRANEKRHKVSILGLGTMGKRHARVLGALPDRFEVVGGFDVRSDVPWPEELAPIERMPSMEEAIARADAVVVATPIEAHGVPVTAALGAGRHVLVEKPLCATAREAYALAGAARGAARLYVGHSERFNPVVRTLARLVARDDLRAIDLRRVGPSSASGVGVLLNLGVHDFDIAAYLGGGEVQLRAAIGHRTAGFEDLAHALVSIAGGAVGHLYVDRTVPTRQRTILVSTQRWVYEGDLLAHRLVRAPRLPGRGPRPAAPPQSARTDVPLPLDEPLTAQALAFADALDGAFSREIALGTDGARAVDLAEQAARQCAAAAEEPASELRGAPR
jgi:UDP-N-acetylglucosamine 3-dehydrogenase